MVVVILVGGSVADVIIEEFKGIISGLGFILSDIGGKFFVVKGGIVGGILLGGLASGQ